VEVTQLSARIWKEQLEIIEKAADKLGKKLGRKISVAEYIRMRVMPHAFEDAGVPVREFPPFTHGRSDLVSLVAQKRGISRREWEQAVLNKAAERAWAELQDEEEPPSDRSRTRTLSDSQALSPPGGMPVARRKVK
jgi:hypothetical protein